MTSPAFAIETQELTKHYGRIRALEGLSLRVEPGEIFGFLGPNGAGKTTTIRLLLGLIKPTSGRASLLGRDVDAGVTARQDLGYLPGTLSLWPGLSGARTLGLLADVTGRRAIWRDELLERLQFPSADLDRRVGGYSDGMRQKLGIVQALQCAPRLVLLDEPFTGLDDASVEALARRLRSLREGGAIIVVATHDLDLAEGLLDRAVFLREGRMLDVVDRPQALRSMYRGIMAGPGA